MMAFFFAPYQIRGSPDAACASRSTWPASSAGRVDRGRSTVFTFPRADERSSVFRGGFLSSTSRRCS
jgi:hypothetical protein